MAYVNAACAGHVTIFSTGGKFRPVSNFTWLHALTLAARSYVLLCNAYHVYTMYKNDILLNLIMNSFLLNM